MPRITSFFSDEPAPKAEGREWSITGTPQNFESIFARHNQAHFENRIVELGFAFEDSDRFIGLCYAEGWKTIYKACLVLKSGPQIFTIHYDVSKGYRVIPNICTLRNNNRFEVTIQGVGKATYRNAWKDSDAKAKIVGFVDVVCENEIDEEALVWFAGTLGSYGLPRPPSS